MKKFFCIVCFLVVFCFASYAQTWAYKLVYSVDPQTEMKIKPNNPNLIRYFTFTKNKQYLQESDKNGYAKNLGQGCYASKYQFLKEQDGHYVYKVPAQSLGASGIVFDDNEVVYVSKDFRRINILPSNMSKGVDLLNKIYVYEYCPNPEQARQPTKMY